MAGGQEGAALRILSIAAGVPRAVLAAAAKRNPGTLSEATSGKSTPRFDTVDNMLRALQLDFSDLDAAFRFMQSIQRKIARSKRDAVSTAAEVMDRDWQQELHEIFDERDRLNERLRRLLASVPSHIEYNRPEG